jgi:hypothetical protein
MKVENLLSVGAGGLQHGFSPSTFSFKRFVLRCETVAKLCGVTVTESCWETCVA